MVYVFLAEGFEEIEALTQIDLLRRADINITSVGVGGLFIKGAHGIEVKCDKTIDDVDCREADMLILPGGMPGVTNLYNNIKLCDIISFHAEKGTVIGAICAAPIILGRLGLSSGRMMTCYPGFENELKGSEFTKDGVVVDGSFITAKSAGFALDFSFELITALKGKQVAKKVFDGIYYDR